MGKRFPAKLHMRSPFDAENKRVKVSNILTYKWANQYVDFKRVLHKALMGYDTILLFQNVKGI